MSEAVAQNIPVDTKHGDDVNAVKIAVWALVSAALTLVSILVLYSIYTWLDQGQREAKVYNATYDTVNQEIKRQENELAAGPRWADDADKAKGISAIPIDRAIEMTLEEYKQEAPQE